jgi:aldehyde:ferredoxin oxidoreductase
MNGWKGKILRIDLSSGSIQKTPTSDYIDQYLGGRGIGARIVWEETGPHTDPLGPDNLIIFSTGPITGTTAPGSGRTDVTGKSPLTKLRGRTNFGGYWAPELKYAGYDHLVISGRAEKPVYIAIDNENVAIKSAEQQWGRPVYETQELIRKELGDPEAKSVCIGPGGENLIPYASVVTELGDAGGRTGMGAICGSKNLKAVAVRGTTGVNIADPEGFLEYTKKIYLEVRNDAKNQKRLGGSGMKMMLSSNKTYMLIYGNYEEPTWQTELEDMQGKIDRFIADHWIKHVGCFNCPRRCMDLINAPGIGYDVVMCTPYKAFSTMVWNTDPALLWEAIRFCNNYGIDTLEAGGAIAYLIHLYHLGLVTSSDTDGLNLEECNRDLLMTLLEKTVNREGVGELLAGGTVGMAETLGKEAAAYAIHTKGMFPHGYQMHQNPGACLLQAVGHKSGDPFPMCSSGVEVRYDTGPEASMKDAVAIFGDAEVARPKSYDRAKVKAAVTSEYLKRIPDMIGVCCYTYGCGEGAYNEEVASDLLQLATGHPYTVSKLNECVERVMNIERAYEIREGMDRRHDTLPRRFFEEPVKDGKYKGVHIDRVKFEEMKDQYYALHGWDVRTGIPTSAKLETLGLKDVIPAMEEKLAASMETMPAN